MYRIKKTAALAIVVIAVVGTINTYAQPNIKITLNAVADNSSQQIDFGENGPICRNDITLVPVRKFAESAGMAVSWNQEIQTAQLTLKTDINSPKPIERYAARLINKINNYGLELTPVSITASLRLYADNAVIRYNFKDREGDAVAIGKYVALNGVATAEDDARLMIPLRSAMEIFGLTVDWNQADTSVSVSIPQDENMIIPTDLRIVSDAENAYAIPNYEQILAAEEAAKEKPLHGAYIGKFKITHYTPGSADNGVWGNSTAWAGEIIPGQTIAVDPNIIPKLSWVYIDGYGLRRAEDCGGMVKGYTIDIAVNSYSEVPQGVVYRDVYWASP